VTVAVRRDLPGLSDGGLKLLQERGETFRDRLVGGIVLGPEPLADFPQSSPSGQDVTNVRTGPADAARAGSYRLGRLAVCSQPLSTKCPLLLSSGIVSLEPAAVRNALLNRG
jgi:hypothetical protein